MYDDVTLVEIDNIRSRLNSLVDSLLCSDDLLDLQVKCLLARSCISHLRDISFERLGFEPYDRVCLNE